MKLSYTIQYVEDVPASVRFYEEAFGLQTKFITPDNDYAEMLTGETTLSFASHALIEPQIPGGYLRSEPGHKPFGLELGFVTTDVSEAVNKAVQAGAVEVAPPIVKPWGQTVAYVRDCNGFLIELCTAMG
jgi:lactoylglutathione lyase